VFRKLLLALSLTLATLIFICGCNTKHEVKVAPLEVKPIHITIDVNIKVDKALDNFFGDLDAAAGAENGSSPTTIPNAK
jgi:hypothetical protein